MLSWCRNAEPLGRRRVGVATQKVWYRGQRVRIREQRRVVRAVRRVLMAFRDWIINGQVHNDVPFLG